MAKNFIILGEINKKLLLPIFLICVQVAYILLNELAFEKQKYNILEMFVLSLGQISIKFVPCILKISNENTNENLGLTKKKKCSHYFILCLLYYFYLGLGTIADTSEYGEFTYTQTNLLPNREFLLMLIIESILLTSISICLLKYKYFKHHFISLVVFFLFAVSCYIFHELELNKIKYDKNYFSLIIRLFQAAVEAIYFCYQKYMMEKLHYPYWNIVLVPGIILLFASVLGIILGFFKEINFAFFSVISYFGDSKNTGLAVLKLITTLIFHIIISPLTNIK